jgi:hypothetical protein
MRLLSRRTTVVAAAAVAVLAAAGAAIAGSGILSDDGEKQAFLNDAAKRLGVTPQKLEDALEGAALARIDAAVAAGRLTNEQGEALKRAIRSGTGIPSFGFGFGFGGRFGHGHGPAVGIGFLDSAAAYLGLTMAQLHEKLRSGKTLAQVAQEQGKSVEGLEQAIVDASKKELDKAVAEGRITEAQRNELLSQLRPRVEDFVQNGFRRLEGRRDGRFHRFRGPDSFRGPRFVPSVPARFPTF